jgi:hypothetical protein
MLVDFAQVLFDEERERGCCDYHACEDVEHSSLLGLRALFLKSHEG